MIACELLLLSRNRTSGIERYASEMLFGANEPYRMILGAPCHLRDLVYQHATLNGWPVTDISRGHRLVEEHLFRWLAERRLPQDTSGIVYFSTSPGLLRSKLPFVLVIHDAIAWRYPQFTSRGMRYMYRPLIEHYIKSPLFRGIITVSEFSRRELVDVLNLRPNAIEVVPNVMSPRLFQVQSPAGFSEIVPGRYFLHVGTVEPRKNIDVVIEAFLQAELADAYLVLAGRIGWGQLPRLPERVLHLPNVADSELGYLYRGAMAVISMSSYEGFGLPILESVALGTRAIVSDIPVYRELFDQIASVSFATSIHELTLKMKIAYEQRVDNCPPVGFEHSMRFDNAVRRLFA